MLDPHGMDPQTVLRFVKYVGGWPGRVFVVACEPDVVEDVGFGLSDAVGGVGRTRGRRRARDGRGAPACMSCRSPARSSTPSRSHAAGRPVTVVSAAGRASAPGGARVAAVLLGDRRPRHELRGGSARARGHRGRLRLLGVRPASGRRSSRRSAAPDAARPQSRSGPGTSSRWSTSKSSNRRPNASHPGEGRRGRARRQQHDRASQPRGLRPPRRRRRQPDERAGRGQDLAARARARRAARGRPGGRARGRRPGLLRLPIGSRRCTSRWRSSTPTPGSAASAISTRTWSARRCRRCRSRSIDLLVIENVGNLVCPAEFRVGEDVRAMVCSITEGEDKPLKYPLMFRSCELVVINKLDLLPHLDVDLERLEYNVDAVNPGVRQMLPQRAHGRGRRRVQAVAGGDRARAQSAGGRVSAVRDAGAVGALLESAARTAPGGRRSVLRRAGRGARAALSPDGRALRSRWPAARLRLQPSRALGRASRRGRVRAPGDRRQAGAPGDRPGRRLGPGRARARAASPSPRTS